MRALVTFHAAGRLVHEGDELDPSDPIILGRAHLFDGAALVVEQATAAPGEVRDLPAKKAAPRKAAARKKPDAD